MKTLIFITKSLVQVNSASKESVVLMAISSLKTKQQEAIKAFMNEKDVFASLPTGYGKSLIYLLLPLIFDRVKGRMILS